ncbi:tyrosine-type recombinase/integrase [Dokdonella soli]|uniref:tyrosine-type recombinase/integrase n=1 Tax=Dokdonella soli TaxID=529810 RepID=UPI0036092206
MNALPALPLPRAALPAVIVNAGVGAQRRFVEFFTAEIRNANTRAAYLHACTQFLAWIQHLGLTLAAVEPVHVAAYIEQLGNVRSAPTVKQHLAALRHLFDYLVVGQVVPFNPAAAVRGPKHSVREGKTPILSADEAHRLFATFDPTRLSDVRDRALLGVMVYAFARVSAVVKLRVRDYTRQGARAWLLLDEKGGKQNKVPVHHQAAEYLEAYRDFAGLAGERDMPLFRSLTHRGTRLTERPLLRANVFHMVRRRMAGAGLAGDLGCHTFRGTGITNFLENGGTIETAARIAGHASTKTTQLYDRRQQAVDQAEVERIRF